MNAATQIKVLVVDDEDLFRRSLRKELNRMGYSVRTAETAEKGLKELHSCPPDVVLLDVHLPDQNGLQVLGIIKEQHPTVEVIMLTAFGSIDSAVEAMRSGAYNYLTKPSKLDEIDLLIQKAFEKKSLRLENRALKKKLHLKSNHEIVTGSSTKMKDLLELVDRVAPTDQTVLIQGESGTGKELIARRLHRLSPRHDRPFVLVDCSSLQKSLLESELFGHGKGAFTGAVTARRGLLEAADTGTLFVDEVGVLEAEIQAKFLRMLESHEYRRVGETTWRQADVRIVAATNIDLAEAVYQNDFREDLFFRLSVIVLQLPPLRARQKDIPVLVEHCLKRAQTSGPQKTLSSQALEDLIQYAWPGNVRELRNVIERACLLAEKDVIEPWNLGLLARNGDRTMQQLVQEDNLVSMRELQSLYMKFVLGKVHGHQVKAAEILEVDPKTIYRNLHKR
ncbi:MAG: sigma-54 dependent transcriptional regulator [Acidobacteriota bacterium]